MKRLLCAIAGHVDIQVREVGLVARPGGLLPSLDGYVAYEPDPAGDFRACKRCRRVSASSSHASVSRAIAEGSR